MLRQSTEGRLSVLDYALRIDAWCRRLRRGGLAVAMLLLVLLAAVFAPVRGPARQPITGSASGSGPTHPVTSPFFAVTLSMPVGWQPTPGRISAFGYDGTSGWVLLLGAASDRFGLHHACTIGLDPLNHPYGLHPVISYRRIDGRPGCLIFPSSDAAALARRTGGAAFRDSMALVEYRRPIGGLGCIPATGQNCLWSLLVIHADPAHLVAIVDSVQLHR